MATEVIMPQLGESVVEGTVGRWLIAEGETIEEYQPLLEVESAKVNTEIPAPASGVLLKVLVTEGSTVSAGTVLALIGQPDEVVSPVSREQGRAPTKKGTSTLHESKAWLASRSKPAEDNEPKREKPMGRGIITPIVARIAAEHGIDLATADIPGGGRGGRITKKDILAYVQQIQEATLPAGEHPGPGQHPRPKHLIEPAPSISAELAEEKEKHTEPAASSGEIIPLTSLRQAIAEHMLRSVRTSAHVTTVMEVDMSRVVAYRESRKTEFQEQEGLKLTFTPFVVQAVIEGLKAVPQANSSLTQQGILLHPRIDIGIAVALESGLIVPVIKDADRLSLIGLQRAVTDLAERARTGKLTPDEVQGSTFTITNHGVSGSLFATAIINQPNSGILGVGAIQKRPVVVTVGDTDSIAIKPMCFLSFTFDHRIIDGAMADRFLAKVVAVLERWG
jgi:2-oxoisovalerate dehydrogenase E2 component (dihydrolipoyl transacylase)